MGENGRGEGILDFCQGKRKQCPGGRREVWRYPDQPDGLLLCRKCYPHRKAILKVRRYQREKTSGHESS